MTAALMILLLIVVASIARRSGERAARAEMRRQLDEYPGVSGTVLRIGTTPPQAIRLDLPAAPSGWIVLAALVRPLFTRRLCHARRHRAAAGPAAMAARNLY
jgi:hypothetical protein